MAASERFNTLRTRIAELRGTFLPTVFDPTGTYDRGVYDKATAFRLLAHAEFESFAEDVIDQIVKEAVTKWNVERRATLPVLCILASYEGNERINAFTDNHNRRPVSISTLINKAYVHFQHNVGQNNGIRTRNLLALLVQVGIEEHELESTWIGSVDSFGAHRNIVGNKSGVVAYQADPKTALDAANSICDGFREIDDKLQVLRRSL